jgi:hypothetical protein
LQESPPPQQDIISILDLDGPFFHDIVEQNLRNFLDFVSALKDCRLLWLTRSAQINTEDPRYAIVVGLARTIRSELTLPFSVLELDALNQRAWDATLQVFEKLQTSVGQSEEMDPDYEFALSKGFIHVSRFTGLSVTNELSRNAVEDAPRRLEIRRRGLLQTLRWAQLPWDPMESDEVEVDVRAVGMNFKVCFIVQSQFSS